MMYAAKFYLSVSGEKGARGFEVIKTQAIPFIPIVGSVFWIGPPSMGADFTVYEICYNLTSEQFEIVLDASASDWRECDAEELAEVAEVLREQGWTIEE